MARLQELLDPDFSEPRCDNAIEDGYFDAIEHLTGLDREEVSREECERLFPEIELWGSIEDGFLPVTNDVIRFAGGTPEAAGLVRGAEFWCDSIGGWDYWYVEGDMAFYLAERSTQAGRLAALKFLAPELGITEPDEYNLEGVSAATERAFAKWLAATSDTEEMG